jgi:hypothetical protein
MGILLSSQKLEYDTLTPEEQETIREDSKEQLLAYLMTVNSSNTATHESMKTNVLEAFIAKRDEYPMSRSDAIALLNKYDERKSPPAARSKGTAFAQKGKQKKGDEKNKKKDEPKEDKSEKKNFYEDKECFICNKKGHGARKCPLKRNSWKVMTRQSHLNLVKWRIWKRKSKVLINNSRN